MKRDMDLIRELLLKLEALNIRPGGIVLIGGHDEELALQGRAADEVGGPPPRHALPPPQTAAAACWSASFQHLKTGRDRH